MVNLSWDLRGKLPSSHSPSATLQSISIYQKSSKCPSFYICWPNFCGCDPRDTPCWLASGGWGGLGSWAHGTVTIEETILDRLPPTLHWTESILKYTISPSTKEATACPVASALGAEFRFGTYLEALKMLSENVGREIQSLWSPSTLLQLTCISQKGAYILVWSPYFCKCYSREITRLWGSAGFMLVVLQDCIYLYSSKATTWGPGFKSAWI